MKVTVEISSTLLVKLLNLYKLRYGDYPSRWDKDAEEKIEYILDHMIENALVDGQICHICKKEIHGDHCYDGDKSKGGKPVHWVCRDGPPRPLMCIRSNCGKEATHEVKSETGIFGVGYCDEHWENRNPDHERALLRE